MVCPIDVKLKSVGKKRLKRNVLDPSTTLRFAQGDVGGGVALRACPELVEGVTVGSVLRLELAEGVTIERPWSVSDCLCLFLEKYDIVIISIAKQLPTDFLPTAEFPGDL